MKSFFTLAIVLSSLLLQAQSSSFNFVVLGDMPYTLPADYARFENLIREVNKQNQVFNVHVGDIKSSETDCSDESYNKMKHYFQQFEKPLVYTPGDNEWTDCNKHNPGKYDIEERLSAIRKLFFNGTTSLGKKTLPLISQSKQPKFATYVENNRWEHQSIAFATFHIVGTNNNFVPDPAHHNREYYGRDSANIAWIDEVFDAAKKNNNKALVLFLHADMFNAAKDSKEANAFADFKAKLAVKVADFTKPVLLVNGDSHVFLVDKPLYEAGPLKKSVVNFTRLQVHGENNMHAVKVTINLATAAIFQIEELIIPGN